MSKADIKTTQFPARTSQGWSLASLCALLLFVAACSGGGGGDEGGDEDAAVDQTQIIQALEQPNTQQQPGGQVPLEAPDVIDFLESKDAANSTDDSQSGGQPNATPPTAPPPPPADGDDDDDDDAGDPPPPPPPPPAIELGLTASTTAVSEDVGSVTFTLSLSRAAASNATIDLSYGGTADGDDANGPANVQITAGATNVNFLVNVNDDSAIEGAEFFSVTASTSAAEFSSDSVTAGVDLADNDLYVPVTGLVLSLTSDTGVTLDGAGPAIATWTDQGPSALAVAPLASANAPIVVADQMGGYPAVVFDGVDDLLVVPNDDAINTGGPWSEKSLVMAFRTGSDVNRRQMIFEQGGSSRGLSVYIDAGQLYFCGWNLLDDDAGATTPWGPTCVTRSAAGETAYVARVVIDQANDLLTAYVNSAEVGSLNGVGNLFAHSGTIGIGGVSDNTYFHDAATDPVDYFFAGQLYDLLLYNALVEGDDGIAAESSLIARYGLDQVSQLTFSGSTNLDEDGSAITISVTRSGSVVNPLGVTINVTGTASQGADFTIAEGLALNFAALQTAATLTITPTNDSDEEDPETINLSFAAGDFVAGSDLNITLRDDDKFTPAGVLTAWLRADSGLSASDGDAVSNWSDISGQAHDATQASAGQEPLFSAAAINSQPALSFDGVDDMLTVANADAINTAVSTEARTMVLVFRTGANVSDRQIVYEQGGSTRGIAAYVDTDMAYINLWNLNDDDGGATTPWGPLSLSASVAANSTYVLVLRYDHQSDALDAWLNGAPMGPTVTGVGRLFAHADTIGMGALSGTTYFHDGASGAGPYAFGGEIAEWQYYGDAQSAANIDRIHSYAAARYGITLP